VAVDGGAALAGGRGLVLAGRIAYQHAERGSVSMLHLCQNAVKSDECAADLGSESLYEYLGDVGAIVAAQAKATGYERSGDAKSSRYSRQLRQSKS
jgi:hypothetical protein